MQMLYNYSVECAFLVPGNAAAQTAMLKDGVEMCRETACCLSFVLFEVLHTCSL